MQNLTHPALRECGTSEPRADVTVDEWTTIIDRLSAQIDDAATTAVERPQLIRQRMDALAARDIAWIARERALAELTGASW